MESPGHINPAICGIPRRIQETQLLRVRILRAERLPKKDLFSLCHPYVSIELYLKTLSVDQVRTKPKKRTRSPSWNEEFIFRVMPDDCKLVIQVFDEKKIFDVQFLGMVELNLSQTDIPHECPGIALRETQFKLQPKTSRSTSIVSGTIFISLSYIQSGTSQMAQSEIGSASQSASTPSTPRVILPEGWEERRDANGRIYYVNRMRRRTQRSWPDPENDMDLIETQLEDMTLRQNYESRYQSYGEGNVHDDIAVLMVRLRESFNDAGQVDPGDGIGPLPEGWEKRTSPGGRHFFVNHRKKSTTWIDPRTGKLSSSPQSVLVDEIGELPNGWEKRLDAQGRAYFIDHISRRTQWDDPRFENSGIAGPPIPYSRDYQCKYEYLRKNLPAPTCGAKCEVIVNRSTLLEDSYRQVMSMSADQLRSKLWVIFDGETGLDFGGVAREWFYLLSREMLNPCNGLFEYSAINDYTLQVNPYSGKCNPDHLSYFYFIGRIIGIAIHHGKLLDAFFIRPFYKMLLGKQITLSDMESVDNLYFNSLINLKNSDPEELDVYFTVDDDFLGETLTDELREGGASEKVTEQNVDEYIELIIRWRFVSRVEQQMKAIKKGIYEVVPPNLLSIFDPNELELLVCGLQKIDVKDWKDNTVYKSGYSANHPVIQNFWKCILVFDNEMRARLLQFVTGTSRVPMNGFRELCGANGNQKFTIEQWANADMLPRAHTCFNRLDLPPYDNFTDMREKMTQAIENSEIFSGVD